MNTLVECLLQKVDISTVGNVKNDLLNIDIKLIGKAAQRNGAV